MLLVAVMGAVSPGFAQDVPQSGAAQEGTPAAVTGDLPADPSMPTPDEASGGHSRNGSSSSDSDSPSGMSGGKKKNKNKNNDTDAGGEGKKFEKRKIGGWSVQPYVKPGGGVQITNNGTSIVAGADVGLLYTKKKITGDAYVGASYSTGDTYNGYELHIGDQTGTRQKYWGLTGGLEGFYDGYTAKNGSTTLAPSLGLDVPIRLVVGPKKYFVYAGVTPSFLAEKSRHARSLPQPIDELEWSVGAGLNTKWATFKAGFTQRITASGVINTPTITGSLDGF
jgi:hypothetical protein